MLQVTSLGEGFMVRHVRGSSKDIALFFNIRLVLALSELHELNIKLPVITEEQ